MVLLVMFPKFVNACKNFVLGQVVAVAANLAESVTLLATHVATVVIFAIVHVKLLSIVEILFFAEVTAWMLLLNVPLKLIVPVERLLKH